MVVDVFFVDSALQFHGEVLNMIDVDDVDVQIQRSDCTFLELENGR